MVCPRFQQNSLFLTCEKVKTILFPSYLKSSHISDRLKNHLSQLIFRMRLLSLQLWYQSSFLFSTLLLIEPLFAWDAAVGYFGHDTNFVVVCVFYTRSHLFVLRLCSSWTHFFLAPQWWLWVQLSKQASNLIFYTQSTSLYRSGVTAFPDLLLLLFLLFFVVVYIFFFIKLLLIHFLLSELEAFCDYCGWWVVN